MEVDNKQLYLLPLSRPTTSHTIYIKALIYLAHSGDARRKSRIRDLVATISVYAIAKEGKMRYVNALLTEMIFNIEVVDI